jgi:hypothetical protein
VVVILPSWLSDAELYVARKKCARMLSEATACSVWGNLLGETLSQFDTGVFRGHFDSTQASRSCQFFLFLAKTSVGGQFNNIKES